MSRTERYIVVQKMSLQVFYVVDVVRRKVEHEFSSRDLAAIMCRDLNRKMDAPIVQRRKR